ncbi:pseudouridine synthase [Limnohabitans sp.]|uniref:pseudouridine synthase n=1 Tax=Limnohabitans sp. TaxID=1907725 RepID=UPI00286EB6F9|nr:pseudouridine synthase [Limnohabitans sp.]
MRIPTRNGVGPSRVSLPVGPWPTVLDFLVARMPDISREEWLDRFAQQLVLNEAAQPVTATQAYTPHTKLYYYRHIANEPVLPEKASLVFEDAHLLVADKPHFMPVTPAGRYVQQSLLVQLKHLTGNDDLVPLHRIDRETAGLVLFGKRLQDRDAYHALFRDQAIHKVYQAVAAFNPAQAWPRVYTSRLQPDELFFRTQEVAGQPNSETHISLLKTEGTRALYQLEPVSGKRHQLRVHMMALGLPLEGDQFYPTVLRGPDAEEDFSHPLQLQAKSIAFTDPVTGEAREFHSALRLSITL